MRCTKLLSLVFGLLISFKSFSGIVAVATLSHMAGEVTVNGQPAKLGDELDVGTKVVVKGEKSWVDFKFQNGHVIRSTEGELKVEDINPEKTLISLIRGKLFAYVKKLGSAETFKVKTKRASFGVRGTKFLIEETKQKSYLCVCEGEVEAVRGKVKVSVKKNQDLDVKDKGALKVIDAPGMGKMLEDMMKSMGV